MANDLLTVQREIDTMIDSELRGQKQTQEEGKMSHHEINMVAEEEFKENKLGPKGKLEVKGRMEQAVRRFLKPRIMAGYGVDYEKDASYRLFKEGMSTVYFRGGDAMVFIALDSEKGQEGGGEPVEERIRRAMGKTGRETRLSRIEYNRTLLRVPAGYQPWKGGEDGKQIWVKETDLIGGMHVEKTNQRPGVYMLVVWNEATREEVSFPFAVLKNQKRYPKVKESGVAPEEDMVPVRLEKSVEETAQEQKRKSMKQDM